MKNAFLKNYGATLLLLLGLVVGGVLGAVLGEDARALRVPGTLFLNLVFMLVVPLVFFSVAHSLSVLQRNGVIGRVLVTSLGVFLAMSLVAGIFGYGFMSVWNPFVRVLGEGGTAAGAAMGEGMSVGDAIVSALTVNDFPLLLSREHLLPLILFSALFGLAVALLGEKAASVDRFIAEGEAVIIKMMDLVMKLAPIGIGCYFADTVGSLGSQIVGDYFEIFLVVSAATAVVYLVFLSLYALFCRVPLGRFWKEMIPPSATAVGTCSSAASMPVNMAAARRLGVSDKLVDGIVPLGTHLHKDGSVVTSVAKVLFALYFFGAAPEGFGGAAVVVLVALLESVVVGAIPVGGMTGELIICAVLGLDPSFAAALLIIGTICDIPATLLNVAGNLAAPLLVQRLTPASRGNDNK
ncbi:MAG: dicarboxylate/amino acid:cation symporter [Bacteroidales bacterium]|jgi:Na+/H+-dicarboxylate symporter|nr:dicarboxylate/amino acid:cation symporter [Bacteroidales bacterium]MDY6443899.1 dicarboxylate/amino acid:cation symporter [Bacteroidales bacterium]